MSKSSIRENWFTDSFKIFFNSLKLYFMNFETFLKLLSFPVLGQIAGLFLIFSVNYFFIMNVPELAVKYPLFNNITFVFTLLILSAIPCFLIFAKAFLDYILAMAYLNLMANHILDKGKLTDVEIHKDIMKSHIGGYFLLLILLSLIYSILSFPLFIILLIPISILFSLAIQAYILEDDLSPIKAIKRSYLFVRYNILKTTFLLIILFFCCYYFLPQVFIWLFDKMNIPLFLSTPIDLYVNLLPIEEFNNILAQIPAFSVQIQGHDISAFIIKWTVILMVIGYTLPIRTIACCDLYRDYRGKNITRDDTEVKKLVKRAVKK